MENLLKVVTVNIEGDNHLDRVLSFLKKEDPDVVCMQEVFASDVTKFTDTLQMKAVFSPLVTIKEDVGKRLSPKGEWGVLILSRLDLIDIDHAYYSGDSNIPLPEFSEPNSVNRVLLSVRVKKKESEFTIATTHFTWSDNGETTNLQRDHFAKLLSILDAKSELILCGDFNAPRGKEIFSGLAKRYTDNIPQEVLTTLDQHLHKVPGLQFVVDGFFTSDDYKATDVRVVDGVSDHKAIVGVVKKV